MQTKRKERIKNRRIILNERRKKLQSKDCLKQDKTRITQNDISN